MSATAAPDAVERPRRARVLTPEVAAALEAEGAFAATPSRRGRLEVVARRKALAVLGLDADGADPWLIQRPSVLAELGRIGDPGRMREAAAWAVAERPSARAAVAELRRRRRGAVPPATADGLTSALYAAFNDYRAAHPDLTRETAREAAAGLVEAIRRQS